MCVNMEERAGHTGSEKWVTELVCCYLCYEIYCFNAVVRAIQCLNNWGQLKTVFEFTCFAVISENITLLGPHTLQLQVLLSDSSTAPSIKSLPVHRIKFTVTGL